MNLTVTAIESNRDQITWAQGSHVGAEIVTAEGHTSWGTHTRLTFDAPAGTHRIGQNMAVTIEAVDA